jgi:transmembrane sensor
MTINSQDKIIIRYLEGKANHKEVKQIADWLDLDENNRNYYISFKKNLIELQLNSNPSSTDTEIAYKKFIDRVNESKLENEQDEEIEYSFINRTLLKYAAIIIILITFSGGAYIIGRVSSRTQNNQYCEISAPLGGKSSIVLPDGTKIWLNAGSKVKYGGDFNNSSRDVYLEGEAYFDVSKKKLPFIVHTSDLNIRVFGTSFNVKSYPDEDKIEATLVEGSIRIDRKESKEPLYLSPKEKLIFHKQGKNTEVKAPNLDTTNQTVKQEKTEAKIITGEEKTVEISKNINVDESVSWKEGSLIFNQESLESLTKKLERKYDITFKFENEELKTYSFSGTLRDFPLEQVLKAIKYTSPINYTIDEKNVILSFNKAFN